MKKIAVFKIDDPKEVVLANEHLSKYPPENVGFTNSSIVINYDDQTFPSSYQADELRGLVSSNKKGMMTTEISIQVGLMDLVRVTKDLDTTGTDVADIKATTVSKSATYDVKIDRQTKIKAYEAKYKMLEQRKLNIESSVATLKKTIENFADKNEILNKEIAKLK